MTYDRRYWQEYYAKNRDKILSRRRKKYHHDSRYRQKIKEAARRYRQKRLTIKKAMDLQLSELIKGIDDPEEIRKKVGNISIDENGKINVGKKRLIRPREVVLAGKKILLFPIAYLAMKLGKSTRTIYHWEKVGILPETPYRGFNNWRLYTLPMINAVLEVFEQFAVQGILRLKEDYFREFIRYNIESRWKELGVPLGQKIDVENLDSAD